MIKLKMKNYKTILAEKQQKKSAKLSGRIDKYEYLTGEEILPSDQSKIIEQGKFTCSPLSKAFQKQLKTIEEQGMKQAEDLKDLTPDENKEPESIEGIFPKDRKLMKLRMKYIELKKSED